MIDFYFLKRLHLRILQSLRFLFFNIRSIPENPMEELNLKTNDSFLYLLPYGSMFDLTILRHQCKLFGLSDPIKKIKVDKKESCSYIFVHKKKVKNRNLSSNYKSVSNSLESYLHPSILSKNPKVQLLFVSIVFHKFSYRRKLKCQIFTNIIVKLYDVFFLIFFKRNIWVRFYLISSLRELSVRFIRDKTIFQKIVRMMMIKHFKNVFITTGPKEFLYRQDLFKKVRSDRIIDDLVERESKRKMISKKRIDEHIMNLIKEMMDDISYGMIQLTNVIFNIILNRIYKKIFVYNLENLYQVLEKKNTQIIYSPSHKSHMDYLLLSYILYRKGMMVPYIIAGINLNFWPIGFLLKKLGAVFIRRSFKKNEIYMRTFQKCFRYIMFSGRSIEYFIEGGRSRTGLLLNPKTGILSTIIKNFSKYQFENREFVIVPVHIMYDKVLELSTYVKELNGKPKEKEGFLKIFREIVKLNQLKSRFGYINFGNPIFLKDIILSKKKYRISNLNSRDHSSHFNQVIDKVSIKIMTSLNNSISINSVNLCSIVLSYISGNSLSIKTLTLQVQLYIDFLNHIPYSEGIVVPQKNSRDLVREFFLNQKFQLLAEMKDNLKIFLIKKNNMMLKYYKNNIMHLFILPSLILRIILIFQKIKIDKIYHQVFLILPIIKKEFFLNYSMKLISNQIDRTVEEFFNQKIVHFDSKNKKISLNEEKMTSINLFSKIIEEILCKYFIVLSFLNLKPIFNLNKIRLWIDFFFSYSFFRSIVIKDIIITFNKRNFFNLINILFQNNFLRKEKNLILVNQKSKKLYQIIFRLIPREIYLEIKSFEDSFKGFYEYSNEK
ncbi:glycerol-3-phosphate acyltransferase, putative [Candidatus Riesia pediculicola USDA]|uniref:Glycerol-3-phosphate acyltransferase n=2 Tax=Candidatus Riesia pediculicola TaxID=401619 RepID=D4G8V0_RIEPU|nr:glycerol-3-phosphate acyltransferase, putative [Candidatus Riesia pediculicola USDA]ARC53962.1 hypothetical protein AOE55_02300 [Candidatus Riesia pediculicola]